MAADLNIYEVTGLNQYGDQWTFTADPYDR